MAVFIDSQLADPRFQSLSWNPESHCRPGRSGDAPMALGKGGFYHLHFGIPAGQGTGGFTPQPTLIHNKEIGFREEG